MRICLGLLILLLITSCQQAFNIEVNKGSIDASSKVPETSWIKQLGFESLGANSAGLDLCTNVDIDPSGNIYCAGFTSGALAETNAGTNDLIVVKFSAQGNLLWIKQYGAVTAPSATLGENVQSLKVDAQGNVYVTGSTLSALSEVNAGGQDIFVSKLNTSGDIQWIKHFGATSLPSATGNDYPYSLDLDTTGNIYLAGYTTSSLFEVSGGGNDVLLMKLDSSGNLLWGKQFGSVTAPGALSSGHDICINLKYKSDSEIYCVGQTSGSFGETIGGSNDAFLMKFNSVGTTSWIKQLGLTSMGAASAGNDLFYALDVDKNGDILATGYTNGNLGETNGGGWDIVVARFSSSGNLLWLKQLGAVTFPGLESQFDDYSYAVKVDSTGNIYTAGPTYGSLGETFGGGNNAYVMKMNSQGAITWIKQLGGETFPLVTQVGVNPCRDLALFNDQPICAGRTNSNLLETNTGNAGDILIFKLKSDGTLDL